MFEILRGHFSYLPPNTKRILFVTFGVGLYLLEFVPPP